MIRVLCWIVQGITGLRKSKRYYWGVNFLVKYKGSIRVVSDFEDFYIDHYEDGKLKILYKIDLCSEVLPDDVLPKTSEEFDAVWNSPEHFKFIGGACEISDWLCINHTDLNQHIISHISTNSGSKYAFCMEYFDLGIMGAMDNYFYALIYPEFAEQD